MAVDSYHCIVLAVLQIVAVESQAVLSVNGIPGETVTFECSYSSITSSSSFEIKKDSVLIYNCGNIGFTCSKLLGDTDYSVVTFTDIGTTSGKGTFTVDNANLAREGGDWTCTYGTSSTSTSVTFPVTSTSTSTSTTVTPTTTTTNSTRKYTTTLTITSTENSTSTYASPTGVSNTSTNTTQIITILGLSEKQRIGLIAGGAGVVVVICCSIWICAIMRRKVNNNKRRRRQERRKALEPNAQISESL